MKSARALLIAAALLLFATALFHASGVGVVSGALPGQRGRIMEVLWYLPAWDWTVVALVWLAAALWPDRHLAPLVWLTALIPLVVAILLIRAVGGGFPGVWMLLGAVILAGLGAARLRHRLL
jgi:hypothetical protein